MERAKDFKRSATLEQRFLLYRLSRLSDRETQLVNEKKWFVGSSDGNEDNYFSELAGYDGQLDKIKVKIMKCLDRAVELGMGDVDIVALNRRYNPDYC